QTDIASAAASTSMCAASESSASECASTPSATSTAMKATISASATLSGRIAVSAPAPWWWCPSWWCATTVVLRPGMSDGVVVGVFHMADEKGPDEKVLCVPLNDPSWSSIADIHDVPPQLRNEIEHFFQVYKDLEGKTTETRGFGNRSDAQAIVAASRERASAL